MSKIESHWDNQSSVEKSQKNTIEQQTAEHIYQKQDLLYTLRTESFDDEKKQQIVSYIFLYSFHDALQLAYHRDMKQEQIIACMSTPSFIQKYKDTNLFSRKYASSGYIGGITSWMNSDRYKTDDIDYECAAKHASLVTWIPMEYKVREYSGEWYIDRDHWYKSEPLALEDTVDIIKSDTKKQAEALWEIAQDIHEVYSPFVSKKVDIKRVDIEPQYSNGVTKTKEFLEKVYQLAENKKQWKYPDSMLNLVYYEKHSMCLRMLEKELQENLDLYMWKWIVYIEQWDDGTYRLMNDGEELDDTCRQLNDTFLAEQHELIEPKKPIEEQRSSYNKEDIKLDSYIAKFKRDKDIYKIKKWWETLYKIPARSFQIMESEEGVIYTYYAEEEEKHHLYCNDKLLWKAWPYNGGINFCYVDGDVYWTEWNSSLYKGSECIRKTGDKESVWLLLNIWDKIFFVISRMISSRHIEWFWEDSTYEYDIYFDGFDDCMLTLDEVWYNHRYQYWDSVLFMDSVWQAYLWWRKIPWRFDRLEDTDQLSIDQWSLHRTWNPNMNNAWRTIETTEIDLRYKISKEQKRYLALLNLVKPLRTTIDIEAVQSWLAEHFADEKKPTLKEQFKASRIYKMFAEHILWVLDFGIQQELTQLNLPTDIEKKEPYKSFIYQLLINLVYWKEQTNPLQALPNAKDKSLYNSPMVFRTSEYSFSNREEKFYQRFLSWGNPESYNFFELEKPSKNMLITHYFPFCNANPDMNLTKKHGEYTSVDFKHFTQNNKVSSLPVSVGTHMNIEDIYGYANYRDENEEIKEKIVIPESYETWWSNIYNTFKCEVNSWLRYPIRIDKPDLHDISTKVYDRYRNSLKRERGSYIDIRIRCLPTELSSFVYRVRHLPPKNRVESIESFVQNIFVFDKEYENLIERNLTFEKEGDYTTYMTTAQWRMIEMKKEFPENEEVWKHKLMAGSDMEYSLIVAQMLKEADIVSGVVKWFYNPESTVLTGKDYCFSPYAQFPSTNKHSGVHILDPYIDEQSMETNVHEYHPGEHELQWEKQKSSRSPSEGPKLSNEAEEKIAKAEKEIKELIEYRKTLEERINEMTPLLETGNYSEKYANFFDVYRFSPIHTMKLQIKDVDVTTSFIEEWLDHDLWNKDTKIEIYNHMRTMMDDFDDNDPDNLSQISNELTKQTIDQKLVEIIWLSVEYMSTGYNAKKLHNYIIKKKGNPDSYK